MEPTNVGHLQARLIIDELTRCGVGRFCLSPGSRNTPLLLAAADNRFAETMTFPDERAAAFFALGLAKATGEPAVLICTSGTAVANYLPAVIEASQSSTPLIVLSADRPAKLRDTGANQTIDQVNIFGGYTRYFSDLPVPDPGMSLRSILDTVDRLVNSARTVPAGPVHLNCQFAEPLTPESDGSVSEELLAPISPWLESREALTASSPETHSPGSEELGRIEELLRASRRGMIVVGQLDGDPRNTKIMDLADRLRMPLLADISSGLRFSTGDRSRLATHYDLYLGDDEFAALQSPDLVFHLGGPLVSRSLNHYLESSRCEYLRIDQTPFRCDSGLKAGLRLKMPPWRFCELCPTVANGPESILHVHFQDAEQICARLLASTLSTDELVNEQAIPWQVLQILPPDAALFLGNSMPVRDADACGITLDHGVRVGVNRGASGIDGSIASALGFAGGLGRRILLLLGDLTFIHDLNSLLLLARTQLPLTIVLVNNDGGGIFSSLPIARYPEHFEDCFATPHGLEFSSLAKSLGIPHFRPGTLPQLRDMTARAFSLPGGSIIEIRTDRERNAEEHRQLRRHATLALKIRTGRQSG